MKLSKTVLKMAVKRGIDITVWRDDESGLPEVYAVWDNNNDNEPLFYIRANNNDNSFYLDCNNMLPSDIWQELPYWIKGEQGLKDVIRFVGKEYTRTLD
jgi:hypothetical protein